MDYSEVISFLYPKNIEVKEYTFRNENNDDETVIEKESSKPFKFDSMFADDPDIQDDESINSSLNY